MNRFSFSLALFCGALFVSAALTGCYTITRTEKDLYTITQSDTTIREEVHNPPGDRENGTIYPSPRTVEISRTYVQEDSVVKRHYPAFLRFGGIEAASFLLTGGETKGSGNGLFGLYDLPTLNKPSDSKLFTANMYRLMPYEIRLRWFDDAPNWTIGTAAFEYFQRQNDSSAEIETDERLMGILPIYIRKRFFFREEPPYIMAVPFFGFSAPWGPSYYVNLGSTLDVGSYGGINFRAYGGLIAGTSSLFGENARGSGLSFPYFGLGVSVLDFVNKTDELFIEWKDHDHSALEVSALNVDIVKAFSDTGAFGIDPQDATSTGPPPITGMIVRVASASIPLPIGDRRWFVGTSLFNLMALNRTDIAFGFLPIRTGYRLNLASDELNLEPFGEFTYYPSTAWHLGARMLLKVPKIPEINLDFPFTINVVAGLVSGSTNLDVIADLDDLQAPDNFTTPYIGIGIGIGDAIFSPAEVMRK